MHCGKACQTEFRQPHRNSVIYLGLRGNISFRFWNTATVNELAYGRAIFGLSIGMPDLKPVEASGSVNLVTAVA